MELTRITAYRKENTSRHQDGADWFGGNGYYILPMGKIKTEN